MKKLIKVVLIAVALVVVCILSLNAYVYLGKKAEVSSFKDSYYGVLARQCENKASFNCCMASVRAMKNGNYKLSDNNTCSDGFTQNMMKCISTFKWCEPINKSGEKQTSQEKDKVTLKTCGNNFVCDEGYVCYHSQYTGLGPKGKIIGEEEGDMLCHKECDNDIDCRGEKCNTVEILGGDISSTIKFCSAENICGKEGKAAGSQGLPDICCSGLKSVGGWPGGYSGDCSVTPPPTGLSICSKCGDSFCNFNTGENKCNCAEDCK